MLEEQLPHVTSTADALTILQEWDAKALPPSGGYFIFRYLYASLMFALGND